MEPFNDFASGLPWFEEWKRTSGEQPPDFAKLRPMPYLPELLRFDDGRVGRTASDWWDRGEEIRRLLQRYVIGTFPRNAPAIVSAELAEVHSLERGESRTIRLTYATEPAASMTCELLVPEGNGPFPVLLAPVHHRGWGLAALLRGYLVVLYPGSDEDDQSAAFAKAYPDCDWSQIGRRAWLACRTLDYVLSMKEADPRKVCIVGHSRYGKQALAAAAFDERIRAVVASSSGTGGACSFRFSSESAFQESVEFITRSFPEWYHPRLRFFTGREHLLPIDCHAWLGLIAPRPVLLSTAWDDPCESAFAVEQSVKAAFPVYRLMGAPGALQLQWRPGGGHHLTDDIIRGYLEWTDRVMAGRYEGAEPEWLFDYGGSIGSESASVLPPGGDGQIGGGSDAKERILWGLGTPPTRRDVGHLPQLGETALRGNIAVTDIRFGEGLHGHLYSGANVERRGPVVIWLHPYAYPAGYKGAYVRGPRIYNFLAESGYTVLAFDQLGFGSRLLEGARFDAQYPGWSRLGKMVYDVRSAVDGLQAIGLADKGIYCLGYSLGGMVALYAGALDVRLKGIASFCGFTPLKQGTGHHATGGIRKLWEWYGLQPWLKLYQDRENELPYDYDDVLRLIAPRPCLLVTPTQDREADAAAVAACVDSARSAWCDRGARDKLLHLSPEDYNRFHADQQLVFAQWLEDACAHLQKFD